MLRNSLFKGFFVVLAAVLVTQIDVPHVSRAQTIIRCDTAEEKAQCQAEYNRLEAEKKQYEAAAATEQAKSSSYERDIALLRAKIKAAQLDIRAKNILIQTLGNDIVSKERRISDLEARIEKGKQTIADLLRRTNEIDSDSVAKILLSNSTVSGFVSDVDTFQSVQSSLVERFEELRTDQAETAAQKETLTNRQNAARDARYAIEQQQKKVEADQRDLQALLNLSEKNKKAYTSMAAQKAAQAAQILAALFPLAGSKAIPFGDALNYAKLVQQKTGVPPSFLLAILTQETNIGANVGTCYMTNAADASGINIRTNNPVYNVMKLTRDVQPFLTITSSLGYDYKTTAISCPQGGFGGGMGPAQFIASTWMLIKDRVKSSLALASEPNPWKPLDAFMASGLYLSDLGGDSTSYTAQWNAACRYYSGSRCPTGKSSYTTRERDIRSYGNSVMALAEKIQRTQIDPLAGL